MTKPSKVLIIAFGSAVGQAAGAALRRLVHHAAGADDLAQEGVGAGVVVLAGGIADGS